MTVLSRDVLKAHGPYVRFADIATWSGTDKYDCPRATEYEDSIFFELADDLLGLLCDITRSYSPFDPHLDTHTGDPHEINILSSELLFWAIQIFRCQPTKFGQWLRLYEGSSKEKEEGISPEMLRADLIDTILHIVGNLNRISASKRTLMIEGM